MYENGNMTAEKPKSRFSNDGGSTPNDDEARDMQLMKEKFAKLLLGEDMSGGGKGVSSALAISNAITNLAASVFGEQTRLEPMPAERKARWRKEVNWLLSVTDHVVEFVASKQQKDGINIEIMITRQRNDLHMDIPALRKLDTMLLDSLDGFKDKEFTYMSSKDADESEKVKNSRNNDKWWLPTPKVPPNGLSIEGKKWLQSQKESVNQVHKAAMAINAQILSEMEIPENYIESLPKNGRASLGDSIYRSITVDFFDPDRFLSSMDLSSDHKILDLKNRIEASIVIWKRKMTIKDNKSSWGSAVSIEKRELFEERAETILLILKHRFPGIPQSSLDISKIQYNRDVGHACLESYSRILESLAYNIMSRIEDVLFVDSLSRDPSTMPPVQIGSPLKTPSMKDQEDGNKQSTPTSMTLLDFMGWNLEQGDFDPETPREDSPKEFDLKKEMMSKPPQVVTNKKLTYLERLETLGGLRSPTARH